MGSGARRLAAAASAALTLTALALAPGADARRPNIVVVMTDDQAVADMQAMPHTTRRLGDHGATFEDFVVSYPLCCPSRATLLTGRYASRHGVHTNGGEHGSYRYLDQRQTLPARLGRTGYETGFIGKYLHGYRGVDPAEPRGWDFWAGAPGANAYRMFDYRLRINESDRHFGEADGDYQTDVYAGLASRFIRRGNRRRSPFFLAVMPLAPHAAIDHRTGERMPAPPPAPRHEDYLAGMRFTPSSQAFGRAAPGSVFARYPWTAADAERAAESWRLRQASLRAVDDLVVRLMSTLRRSGQLSRTYVLFTSDNGFALGEHRWIGKQTAYEESLRVPLLVRGPGIQGGMRVRGVTSNIDLAPTILQMARAGTLAGSDGRSLLPFLRGRREISSGRTVLIESLARNGIPRFCGVRNRNATLVEYANGKRELYDRITDPDQLRDVYGLPAYAAAGARLSAELDAVGKRCRRIVADAAD